MKKLIFIKAICCVVFIAHNLRAQQNQPKPALPKKNIAVMNFQANNCPASLGRALSDLLAGKLFNSEYFILLEQNQVEKVIKQKKIKTSDTLKEDEAAKLGRMLQVEKIVVGSVSKFDNYVIQIRIIDVNKGSVDFSVSEETTNFAESI